MQVNPYEAPKSAVGATDDTVSNLRVDGKLLVIRDGDALPLRCFKCNAECGPGDKRITKKLYYVPVWVYLFILLSIPVLAIIYFVIRKPVSVTYSQCTQHARKATRETLLGIASLIVAIAGFVTAGITDLGWLALVGFAGLITFLVFLVRVNRTIQPTRHQSGEFWMRGLSPSFLESVER